MSVLSEFRDFITRGNVLDLAVAFIIGAAFTAVVTALVADLITPLIGIAGNFNFASWHYSVGKSTFATGLFLNALLSFIIIAAVVFFALVKPAAMIEARRKAKLPAPPPMRDCPECLSKIPVAAHRCSFCTSAVGPPS